MSKRGRPPKRLSGDWVRGRVLLEKFGFGDDHLKRLREDGTLKQSVHWLNIGRKNASRPTYRYNLTECEKVLAIAMEER